MFKEIPDSKPFEDFGGLPTGWKIDQTGENMWVMYCLGSSRGCASITQITDDLGEWLDVLLYSDPVEKVKAYLRREIEYLDWRPLTFPSRRGVSRYIAREVPNQA